MAGRKPIVSARQIRARVQIILRATDKDVAQNSEKNRLMDMIEAMTDAGVLQEFLLDALKSKLRQDEGQSVVANKVVEGGQETRSQRTIEAQAPRQQETHQRPDETLGEAPESKPPVVESGAIVQAPLQQHIGEPGRGPDADETLPSAAIQSVIRVIESDDETMDSTYRAPVSNQGRKPRGNMLAAMG